MSSVRKFQFDESFDVDAHPGHGYAPSYGRAEERAEPPPPPPPTYTEEDLGAAREAGFRDGISTGHAAGREQGYAEGRAAGQAEGAEAARAELEASEASMAAHALDRIARGVGALLAAHEAAAAARSDLPVHIALAIVRKLMPEFSRRHGLAEIEGLVRNCLTELMDEPRLVVRVSADLIEAVRGQVNETIAASGFDTKLVVVADPELGPGDCRVEWAEGGAERDIARLLADVEQCAERLLEAGALP